MYFISQPSHLIRGVLYCYSRESMVVIQGCLGCFLLPDTRYRYLPSQKLYTCLAVTSFLIPLSIYCHLIYPSINPSFSILFYPDLTDNYAAYLCTYIDLCILYVFRGRLIMGHIIRFEEKSNMGFMRQVLGQSSSIHSKNNVAYPTAHLSLLKALDQGISLRRCWELLCWLSCRPTLRRMWHTTSLIMLQNLASGRSVLLR